MKAFLVLALLLAGCSSLSPEQAPGCRGARRPANPHGSVLASTPQQAAPAAAPRPGTGCGGGR